MTKYVKYIGSVIIGFNLLACGSPSTAQITDGSKVAAAHFTAGQAYVFTSTQSSMVMGVVGGSNDAGAGIEQEQAQGASTQQWTVQAATNGAFALINVGSDKALTLPGSSGTAGQPLAQDDYSGGSNQQWQLQQNSDGSYNVVSSASSQCLDDPSASMQQGALLQQWNCADSSEMHWQLVGADSNTTSSPTSSPNTTTPPATGSGSPSTGSGNLSYSVSQLTTDISNVLQLRSPIYSDRNLGNPSNIALWTPDKVQSLYNGIVVAQGFFPQFALADLAHLIISEGAQESTGDYNLAGYSVGFLQVSPTSVVNDYTNHGTAIAAPAGGSVIAPNDNANLDDPQVNVAFWAWYTYNAVAAGESVNEVALGDPQGGVTRDFGNCEFDWLAGPHNDRHNPSQAPAYQDYHDRIKDYFVQSQFGSADDFESLLNTTTGSQLQDFH